MPEIFVSACGKPSVLVPSAEGKADENLNTISLLVSAFFASIISGVKRLYQHHFSLDKMSSSL
jgi:hypothetical protein